MTILAMWFAASCVTAGLWALIRHCERVDRAAFQRLLDAEMARLTRDTPFTQEELDAMWAQLDAVRQQIRVAQLLGRNRIKTLNRQAKASTN